jgi:hypothetical protein
MDCSLTLGKGKKEESPATNPSHCKERLAVFPAGDGKTANFFYSAQNISFSVSVIFK